MKQHTALLGLPDELRAYGLNVVALDEWDTAQGAYKWTLEDKTSSYDSPPSGVMFHGTAGTRSVPVVRNWWGQWSKANAWVGLDDGDGTLYASAVIGKLNRPTIHLTSAGPARWSSGRGYWPVMQQVFNDIRPPLDAEGRDGLRAANRHLFNVENTHPNDGSLIDPDVYDHLVGLGAVLHDMFGWRERTIGHRSWTRRKPVDPWFVPGGLPALQDDIRTVLEGDIMPLWQWHRLIDSLFTGRPDEFQGDPPYFKNPSTLGGIADLPDHPDWDNFWSAYVRVIS